jgi:hypothetical protein
VGSKVSSYILFLCYSPKWVFAVPTDREISRACAKFDLDNREEAAYILWHVWKDKGVAYEACIAALNEDGDLYQGLRKAHEAKKYKPIVNWGEPFPQHQGYILLIRTAETPSAHFKPDDNVQDALHVFLEELRSPMASLVQGEIALEYWQPPQDDEQDPDIIEHLNSLEIPCLKGKPNILLHDLGTFQEDEVLLRRLQNIFMANNHTYVILWLFDASRC